MRNPFRHISGATIGHTILALWIAFSVAYIANDVWQGFKANELEQAAQAGYQKAVSDLIQQAQTCDPIPVFAGENKIELIKADCKK